MKRLEEQYMRKIRQWLTFAVVTQGFIAVAWVFLMKWLPTVQLVKDNEHVQALLALISIPLPSGLAFYKIERYRHRGWRRRNRDVDFAGEWRFDAEITSASADPLFNQTSPIPLPSGVVGTKLFGVLYIDQTTGSIQIRRGRIYDVHSRLFLGVWKSTSCRLSESGDEIRLSYVVHRSNAHDADRWFGDRGFMQLDVVQAEAATDTRPLRLAGMFYDAVGSGRIASLGKIELSRCITKPGTIATKQFFMAASDELLCSPVGQEGDDAPQGGTRRGLDGLLQRLGLRKRAVEVHIPHPTSPPPAPAAPATPAAPAANAAATPQVQVPAAASPPVPASNSQP